MSLLASKLSNQQIFLFIPLINILYCLCITCVELILTKKPELPKLWLKTERICLEKVNNFKLNLYNFAKMANTHPYALYQQVETKIHINK